MLKNVAKNKTLPVLFRTFILALKQIASPQTQAQKHNPAKHSKVPTMNHKP